MGGPRLDFQHPMETPACEKRWWKQSTLVRNSYGQNRLHVYFRLTSCEVPIMNLVSCLVAEIRCGCGWVGVRHATVAAVHVGLTGGRRRCGQPVPNAGDHIKVTDILICLL